MVRVLVLDANQRAALAVVRSLGRHGLTVIVADSTAQSLAGASRYASASLVHPLPQENPNAFLQWMDAVIVDYNIDAILPVTEISTDVVVRNRQRWPATTIPFAPIELIDRLSNKVALFELAQSLGVDVPRSVIVRNDADLEVAQQSIGFPCILKPHRSRVLVDGRWLSTSVRRADDPDQLKALLGSDPGLNQLPLLYQEFIPGHGAGVFALYKEGVPQLWFAHRRLREKPPGGGVSVLSESVRPDPGLVAASQRLLDAVGWQGVAMVEYRVSPDGVAYLMEVNARFWGSLQLAIDAGADFPARLLGVASQHGDALAGTVDGRRLRWLLGDLDRLWLVYKGRKHRGWHALLREGLAFITPDWSGRTRHETFRWDDPRPAWAELCRYVRRQA